MCGNGWRHNAQVGALLFDFWDIQTCGQFMVSFFFIVALCFVRHMLQMHKTRYILTLPTGARACCTYL